METHKELKKARLRWELLKVGTGGRSPPSDLGFGNESSLRGGGARHGGQR
jgi:hypothetical protein